MALSLRAAKAAARAQIETAGLITESGGIPWCASPLAGTVGLHHGIHLGRYQCCPVSQRWSSRHLGGAVRAEFGGEMLKRLCLINRLGAGRHKASAALLPLRTLRRAGRRSSTTMLTSCSAINHRLVRPSACEHPVPTSLVLLSHVDASGGDDHRIHSRKLPISMRPQTQALAILRPERLLCFPYASPQSLSQSTGATPSRANCSASDGIVENCAHAWLLQVDCFRSGYKAEVFGVLEA
jgi:hypothetical protein